MPDLFTESMTFCVPVMPPSYVSLPPSPLALGWSLVLLPSTAATWKTPTQPLKASS